MLPSDEVAEGEPVSGNRPATAVTFRATMGFGDVWNRTLVYFGIAEEEEWDEDGYLTDEELQRAYAERPNVRRLAPRRSRREDFDDWTDPEPGAARTSVLRPAPEPRRLRGVESMPAASVKVHLVLPRSFNDAQQIADRFKEGVPVILNLQGSDQDLAKRLIDFGSGLTYALDGGMQRVADKVFLLTPRNVEVSAEERARLLERGGFFNQA
jgi:cell division inhibitor SepF